MSFSKFSSINWSLSVNNKELKLYRHLQVVSIDTINDGSCYIHALLQAIYAPYRDVKDKNKRQLAKDLRKSLAEALEEKDDSGVTTYDKLAGGQLKTISKELTKLPISQRNGMPDMSLTGLKEHLMSEKWIGTEYHELICDIFDINIYILHGKYRDVLLLGDCNKLYKKRRSIVILCVERENHYETVGVTNKDGIDTVFSYDHPLIVFLSLRMQEIVKLGSKYQAPGSVKEEKEK